jgi:hypothetical protein
LEVQWQAGEHHKARGRTEQLAGRHKCRWYPTCLRLASASACPPLLACQCTPSRSRHFKPAPSKLICSHPLRSPLLHRVVCVAPTDLHLALVKASLRKYCLIILL